LNKIKENNQRCIVHGNQNKTKKDSFVVDYKPYDDFFEKKSKKMKIKDKNNDETICTCTNEDNVDEIVTLKAQLDKMSSKNEFEF